MSFPWDNLVTGATAAVTLWIGTVVGSKQAARAAKEARDDEREEQDRRHRENIYIRTLEHMIRGPSTLRSALEESVLTAAQPRDAVKEYRATLYQLRAETALRGSRQVMQLLTEYVASLDNINERFEAEPGETVDALHDRLTKLLGNHTRPRAQKLAGVMRHELGDPDASPVTLGFVVDEPGPPQG